MALVSSADRDHVVEGHRQRRLQGLVALQPRQLDHLLHEVGEAVALGDHAAGEPADRLGVVGGVVDGVGQQPDRAHRGLELVADVGDEVAPHQLDPALAGAVLGEHQHHPRPQRGHPHGDVSGRCVRARQHELGLADLAVAAHLAHHRGEVRGHQRGAAHQAHRVRRRRGLAHDIGVVDDDGAAAQHREHGGHGRWHRGLLDRLHAVLQPVAHRPREHAAARDDSTDRRGQEDLEGPVHIEIVRFPTASTRHGACDLHLFTLRSRRRPGRLPAPP